MSYKRANKAAKREGFMLGHGPANGVRQKDRSKARPKKTGYKKRKRA